MSIHWYKKMSKSLTIIGTGSTQGNCHILDCDGEKLILDAGVRIEKIKKALNWNVKDVKGALVTHVHLDHSRSEDSLRLMGIEMMTPYHGSLMAKAKRLGNFRVAAFEVPHNGTPNYGFLIQYGKWKMVYITDMEYCPFSFQNHHLNAMLIECNHTQTNLEASNYAHVVLGHASLDVTKEFVRVNATGSLTNVILCHLSDTNADPQLIQEQIESVVPPMTKVDIAEKGMVIEL